jgi:uncharacterized membrane protein
MTKRKICGILIIGLAFIGMVDSAYVAINSVQKFIVPCGITQGCDEVLNSPYARIAGVSIAWGGLLFYACNALSGMLVAFGFESVLRWTLPVSLVAFVCTLYLFYLQAFVVLAFCDYCLLSATLVTLILIIHLWARPWRA